MINQLAFKSFLASTTLRFSITTYSAIAINALSGVFLARSIGATERGIFAYYANFLLLTSFMSASNISNATARIFAKGTERTEKNLNFQILKILSLGFLIAFASAFIVSSFMIEDWKLNKYYFALLMVANGFAAYISMYDGYWRFSNSISMLTRTRFVGLAAPSLITLSLLALGIPAIEFLLLGQLVVILLNLYLIFKFKRNHPAIEFPAPINIFKSASKGFPTYLAEYLVSWIIPFLILQIEGSEVLGCYVVALSYALLADVTYTAIEAKNYKSMLVNYSTETKPQIKVFLKNSFPILLMHLIFIPTVLLIPIIYGEDFKKSSLFAFVILIVRIPVVIARSMTSFLISLSKNMETFWIFTSFLLTFTLVMLLSGIQAWSFYWIPAYAIAATIMLLTSIFFLFRLKMEN